jgi:beta-lactamase class A
MPGFWYTTAVTTTCGAVLGIIGGLKVAPIVSAWAGSSAPSAQAFKEGIRWRSQPSNAKDLNPSTANGDQRSDSATYDRALELANQAVAAYQQSQPGAGDSPSNLEFIRRERFLWRASLRKLAEVPPGSARYEQAVAKHAQYQRLLATAENRLAAVDSAFLSKIIVEAAGTDPQGVHITLCQMGDADGQPIAPTATQVNAEQCRYHQGDELMASPASLIKVPVAIALIQKTTAEDIDLDSLIFMSPGNFTEDADDEIQVGQKYPLRKVMTHMINKSNNTATNQLIDYVGRDYMAKVMAQMGYDDTLIDHKLVGDRIFPTDPGNAGNESTTDDITAMMMQIYSLKTAEDKAIVDALSTQSDRELGHQALQGMGPAISWVGEKTGQNERVLGTTLVMKVGEERYALTVALDNSGDTVTLRRIVRAIAAHTLKNGPIMGRLEQ